MIRVTISLLFALYMCNATAQEINIIPKPVEIKKRTGTFNITKNTVIAFDQNTEYAASFLKNYLDKFYNLSLRTTMHHRDNVPAIFIGYSGEKNIPNSYQLEIEKNRIFIMGDKQGAFLAIQTLIQLLPLPNPKSKIQNLKLPLLTITDYPRFAYRGMHLDCGRHFWSVDFIKKYIDYLALHKFNTFHWHLTEDQGWRIEIKKYPALTAVGGWRNGTLIGRYPGTGNDNIRYGGHYTQTDIKEIVQYAKDRFIDVIPEIEMPGHSSAAIAAYPELSCFPDKKTNIPTNMISKQSQGELERGRVKVVQETWGVFDDVFCAGKESTFQFLENVIDEVTTLFPSRYFHIGGDECPKTHWKECAACQKRMKDHNLKDEHELQSYFVQRIEKYLNSKGKTLIGWDEILEGGLAPNAVVMSWRGEAGGIEAAKQNHDVVMTPGNPVYFDHTQSENEDSITIGGFNPIEKVYAYEPIPAALDAVQAKHVLGAQANVWTEYMKNTNKVEYMIFPRMAALSEVLWSKKEDKDWQDFEKRLQVQFKRYDLWKANYSKAYYDLKAMVMPTEDNNGVLWKVETKNNSGFIHMNRWSSENTMNISMPEIDTGSGMNLVLTKVYAKDSFKYTTPLKIKSTGFYEASIKSKTNTISLLKQIFNFNKATGKKITLATPPSQKYPGDGAFTLVNGVQNEKGFARSKEFIGFSGANCEAIIDLGKPMTITETIVHCLHRPDSWIWRPLTVEVHTSTDGTTYTPAGLTDDFITDINSKANGTLKVSFAATQARFIKIIVKCWDEIPAGEQGAGNKPWLFLDEVEVN
jgi:hexosaminidase